MANSRGTQGRTSARAADAVEERAHRRRVLIDWDARWHRLSPAARNSFLNVMRGPAQYQADHAAPDSIATNRFPPGILAELTDAGFARIVEPRTGASTRRVIAPAAVYDFAARVRLLNRLHLLRDAPAGNLFKFVHQVFDAYELLSFLTVVLASAGITDVPQMHLALDPYIGSHRWPGWIAGLLNDPLADRVLELVREADGPIPLLELIGRVKPDDPRAARAAVDGLIARMALFEDVDPATFDIVVGFLPSVREGLRHAAAPRSRPPLSVCERPVEVGPDDSPIAGDLRAFLLEVASEPPKLRQSGQLFQKEMGRFLTAFTPLTAWLTEALQWKAEGRLNQAMSWAWTLDLVTNVTEMSHDRIRLTTKGEEWLAGGLDKQYESIYALAAAPPKDYGHSLSSWRLFSAGPIAYGSGVVSDAAFLGEDIVATTVAKGRHVSSWAIRPDDMMALRRHLDRSFAGLERNVFYRLESIGPHLAYGAHNPLNLGMDASQVAVFRDSLPMAPLEEHRETAARLLIESFIRRRLIPLGCVQAAIDGEGKLCVARLTRLDAYFGREVPRSALAPAVDAAARVVVQPDFSVIVIGPNPAAAAELAPFCERTTGGAAQGAMILKLTRDSVVKAVSHGLDPAEIAERLRRHASHELPANVQHEVKEWSSWVRQVTPATLTVLRCPDRDTADRVMAALRKQAERVNDTLVALDARKLTPADRARLITQGIVVGDAADADAGAGAKRKSKKKKKKRSGW
jgi:hypothetical protein